MGPYGFLHGPTIGSLRGSMGPYGSPSGRYGSCYGIYGTLCSLRVPLCVPMGLYGALRASLKAAIIPPLLGAAMTPRASLPAQSGSRLQTREKRRGWKVGGGGGSFWDQKPPFGVGAERPETALRGPEGAKEEKERLKGGAHRRGDPAEPQRFDEGGGGGRRPLLRWGPTAPFRRAPFCPSAGHGPSREGF